MFDLSQTSVDMLTGAIIAMAGAILAISKEIIQKHITNKGEQQHLLSLIRGELKNIITHCNIVESEIYRLKPSSQPMDILANLEMTKYGDIQFLNTSFTRLGFINDDIVKDILQLSLFIRNNDIDINSAILLAKANKTDPIIDDIAERIRLRMNSASSIATKLLQNIKSNHA